MCNFFTGCVMKLPQIEPLESRIAPAGVNPASISISDATFARSTGGHMFFTLTLDEPVPAGETVVVNYHTADGLAGSSAAVAVAGLDYTANTGTIIFTAGQTTKTIDVSVLATQSYESGNKFTVDLDSAKLMDGQSNPALQLLNGQQSATAGVGTGVLTYSNPLPTVSISAPSPVAGGHDEVFTVSLSAVQDHAVTVTLNTTDGSGSSGKYTSASNVQITIPAGSLSVPYTIATTTNSDTADATFSANLSNPQLITGGSTPPTLSFGTSSAQATILGTTSSNTISIVAPDPIAPPTTTGATSTLNFTVNLGAPAAEDVTVHYHITDGTATLTNNDYSDPNGGTVTIPQGSSSVVLPITIPDNAHAGPNKTFSVQLDSAEDNDHDTFTVNSSQNQATGVISGTHLSFSTGNITINESTGMATITVVRTGYTNNAVSVHYSTTDGTALAGVDYTAPTGSNNQLPVLNFAAGQTQATITIPLASLAHHNSANGDNATFGLTLSAPQGADIGGPATENITIHDDNVLPVIGVSSVTANGSSTNTTTLTFHITLDHAVPTGEQVVVGYHTVNGSAIAPYLYTALSASNEQTLTFAAGETSKTVTVTVNSSLAYAPTETFDLVVDNAQVLDAQSHLLAPLQNASGTATLHFSNAQPTVSISAGPTVQEGGTATFTATISAAQSVPTLVKYTTHDGTAHAGTDYTGQVDQFFIIPAGQTSTTFSVQTTNNGHAGTDQNFSVQLETANLQYDTAVPLAIATDTTQATIQDSTNFVSIANPQPITPDPTISKTLNFTVSLGGIATQDIVIHYHTIDGPMGQSIDGEAVSGTNYKDTNGGTVTIHAGQSSALIPIEILANSDSSYSLPKDFQIQIDSVDGGVTGGSTDAVGTIKSSVAVPSHVGLDSNSQTVHVNETDGTVTLTIHRSGDLSLAATVDYTTVDGTAKTGTDYTKTSGTATFDAGSDTVTIHIPLIDSHKFGGGTEQFTVNLSNPVGADVTSGQATGTVTITNNDSAPSSFSIDPSMTVDEAAGTVTLTVHRTGSDLSGTASVNISTLDGSAKAGTNYTAKSTTLNFAADQTSATFTVPITDLHIYTTDTSHFPTFQVKLSSAQNADITNNQDTSTVTISESGAQTHYSISGPGSVLSKSDTATFTITRDGDTSAAGSVVVSTKDGTARGGLDYTTATQTINFAAGQTTATFAVKLLDLTKDSTNPNFSATLSTPQGGDLTDGSTSATATIKADAPTVSIGNASVIKTASGSTQAVFTVKLSGPDYTDAVKLNYSTADGTAFSIGQYPDFIAALGKSITFAAGTTSQTISIEVNGNDIVNPFIHEQFAVNLDLGSGAGSASTLVDGGHSHLSGTGTIIDNVQNTVTIGNATATEGGQETFTVTLAHPSATPVKVFYNTSDLTAKAGTNYTAAGAGVFITIPAYSTTGTITIATLDDGKTSPSETFLLKPSLQNPGTPDANFPVLGITSAIGTITNIHTPTITIDPSETVNIGANSVTFTVTLSEAATAPVTVHYQTADGTAHSSGTQPDYTAEGGTLTFAPGDPLTKTITVPVTSKTYLDASKAFTVALSDPTNAILSATSSGTATILPNSNAPVGVTIADVQHVVAKGSNTLTITVNLTQAAQQEVDFTATPHELKILGAAAAKAGVDFNSTPISVKIPAGNTTFTFTVPVLGKDSFQADRTFGIDFSGFSSNAVALNTSNVDTILGDVGISGKTAKWHDVDGDLVTLNVSKGSLAFLSSSQFVLQTSGNLGGSILQELDLSGDSHLFAKANVSVTAQPVRIFPASKTVLGDGHVNVGYIVGNPNAGDTLENANANDLGVIRIDGDLARIDTGDIFSDAGLAGLNVLSFGTHSETLPSGVSTGGIIVGPAPNIHVAGDFKGSLHVIGLEFGSIGKLTIGGTLSGTISFTSHLGNAVIGAIDGSGTGSDIGEIEGNLNTNSTIGSIKVLGAITGGSSGQSGLILASRIGSIDVGSIVGGSGSESGLVFAQNGIGSVLVRGSISGGSASSADSNGISGGAIATFGAINKVHVMGDIVGAGAQGSGSILGLGAAGIGSVTVDGNIRGGGGANSGDIESAGSLGMVKVGGSVIGGSGADSGEISARGNATGVSILGFLTGGAGSSSGAVKISGVLGQLQVGKARPGFDPYATVNSITGSTGASSGEVSAAIIGKAAIHGNILGGSGAGSGSIQSTFGSISSLVVDGGLLGASGAKSGFISAAGAIGSLQVGVSGAAGRSEQSLLGGSGANSGEIAAGSIGTGTIFGSLQGGTANFTGGIDVTGAIGTLHIAGGITGGDSNGTSTTDTGFVSASTIKTINVDGNITAGVDYGNGLVNSGAINATVSIGSVVVGGAFQSGTLPANVQGTTPGALIAAGGKASGLAIGKVDIKGKVAGGQILAGVSTDSSGTIFKSADAQINSVLIENSSVTALVIAAGAAAGSSGDLSVGPAVVLAGTGVIDQSTVVSKIASVIFSSATTPVATVVAQEVDAVSASSQNLILKTGAGNDAYPATPGNLVAYELPVPNL